MLILASKSPRRNEILGKICNDFVAITKDCDETLQEDIDPADAVQMLSKRKAEAVFVDNPDATVIGSDTIVSINGEILTKPLEFSDAYDMLTKLSGNVHQVYTGVTILSKQKEKTFYSKADVEFAQMSREEIEWYINSNEIWDKAGSYGIQGFGCRFIKGIVGDYYTVMGLPAQMTYEALKEFDY